MKTVVDNQILFRVTGNPNAKIVHSFTPFKFKTYKLDEFRELRDYIIGLFFLISLIPPLVGLIGKLMDDKMSKMRETLKIMGLSDFAYYLGYFIFYAAIQAVVSFLSPLIVYYFLFPKTNYFLLSSFFFGFCLTLFPTAIIIT